MGKEGSMSLPFLPLDFEERVSTAAPPPANETPVDAIRRRKLEENARKEEEKARQAAIARSKMEKEAALQRKRQEKANQEKEMAQNDQVKDKAKAEEDKARQEAVERSRREKQEALQRKRQEEAAAKAKAEAKAEEDKARQEAVERSRRDKEAALERKRQEEAAKEAAKAKAKAEAEAKAKAKAEAEAKAKAKAAAEAAKAKADADAKAKAAAEAKAKAVAGPMGPLLAEQERDLNARNVNAPMTSREIALAQTHATFLELRVLTPRDAQRAPDPRHVFLKPARTAFAKAVNGLFAQAKYLSVQCKPNALHMVPNRLLKPIAIYEVESLYHGNVFRSARQVAANSKCDPREPPVPCNTDGFFQRALSEVQGGARLEPNPPLNEKILLHATEPDVIDKILQNGMNENYSSKGQRYGPGIYMADQVCKAGAYAGEANPNATITRILRLTQDEATRAKFMLVFRVVLGCAARTTRIGQPPQQGGDWTEAVRSQGPNKQLIYAPASHMGDWHPPFTSLVSECPLTPREYLMKNKQEARILLVGVVAYQDTTISSQQGRSRVTKWW